MRKAISINQGPGLAGTPRLCFTGEVTCCTVFSGIRLKWGQSLIFTGHWGASLLGAEGRAHCGHLEVTPSPPTAKGHLSLEAGGAVLVMPVGQPGHLAGDRLAAVAKALAVQPSAGPSHRTRVL